MMMADKVDINLSSDDDFEEDMKQAMDNPDVPQNQINQKQVSSPQNYGGSKKPNPFKDEEKKEEQKNANLLDFGDEPKDKSDEEFPDDIFSDGGPNIQQPMQAEYQQPNKLDDNFVPKSSRNPQAEAPFPEPSALVSDVDMSEPQ